MRRSSLAPLLYVAAIAPAVAADLPLRNAPSPPPLPPSFTWNGAYVGINAGDDVDHDTRFRQSPGNIAVAAGIGTSRPPLFTSVDDGFTGGVQIGYNQQLITGGAPGSGPYGIVVGFEADASYTDLSRTTTVGGPTAPAVLSRFHSELDFLGTVRGRLGLAVDRVLVYGTGGFAYGLNDDVVTLYNDPAVLGGSALYRSARNTIDAGYAVGGGLEVALPAASVLNVLHAGAMSVKVEYLYYNLGSHTLTLTGRNGAPAGSFVQSQETTDGNLVRAGLNYRF